MRAPKTRHKITLFSQQGLAKRLPIAMLLCNRQAEVLWWNRAAEKLLALTKKKKRRLSEIFSKFTKTTFSAKDAYLSETTLVKQPKKYVSLSLVAQEKQQFLLIAQDVTHLHNLEIMRRDFIANVSHELRTPLTVIHGYLEMLLEQPSIKKPNLQAIFTQMHQQTLLMEKLVEDLLLLSRLETVTPAQENFKPLNIAALLQRIAQDAKALSRSQKHVITLDIDERLKIYGLADELQSAFANLIFNAVKYTPAKGHIAIKWYSDKNNAYMSVQDTGIGIAPQHIPRITERFYRTDRARSRNSGGTGLGLAIVKHALIRHAAELKITSRINKGSVFTCVFPKRWVVKSED